MKPKLTGIGIAITRPVDQAKKLAELIRNSGGMPILFPLIEITPLSDYSQFESVISEINSYDWAIFISSNAVQNGMPRLIKQGIPTKLKFAAIGPVTANELQGFGVANVLVPNDRFDSESLLALPEMTNVVGKKVMIFRGVGGRDVLAETLKKCGAQVTFAECYQRINPQTNCDLLAQLYAEKKLHVIVVTSSEAMRYLLDLAGSSDWLKHVTLFVNHARVAELPTQLGLKVVVANAAGDDAMLEVLLNVTKLKKSKIDKLMKAYIALGNEFHNLGNPKLEELALSYLSILSNTTWLNEISLKSKKSQIVAGLEQGLREIPSVLSKLNLPNNVLQSAFKAYYHVVKLHLNDFLVKDREKLGKVMIRGKIKNENEFYLLRNRVDEIEGISSHETELLVLYKLLDNFEKM